MHTCTIDVLVKGLSDYDFSSALIKKKQDKAASAPSEVLSHRMRASARVRASPPRGQVEVS